MKINKKKKIILIFLGIVTFIGYFGEIKEPVEATTAQEQNIQEKVVISEQSPLLKYEIIKIEELQKNRLKITVLVKEKPTIEQLNKLSEHLVNVYIKNKDIYGIYLNFTHSAENPVATYGQAEYGPNGSAGYNDKNLGKDKKLDVSHLDADNQGFIDMIDESTEKEKLSAPHKEALKKHLLNIIPQYNGDIDSLLISTYDDGFEVSFTIKTNEINLETVGLKTIKEILNSNLPEPVIRIDIILNNKFQTTLIGYNGEKYYKQEGGETIDIEM